MKSHQKQAPKRKSVTNWLGDRVDSVIGIFSPAAAMRNQYIRTSMNAAVYRGADRTRLRGSWVGTHGSADADLLNDLPLLRERSRDLNRNDAHASGITATVTTNVVGTGIRPQSRVDRDSISADDATVTEFQKRAERVWQKWVPFADAGDRMDFYDIESLVLRQILENGEALVLPVAVNNNVRRPYFLALNVVEADRLATPSDLRSNGRIRSGVEIGDNGEPIAYHIRQFHPGDGLYRVGTPDSNKFIRYPAFNDLGRPNVLHLYPVKRPGQSRGEPFFAPVMNYFKDMADYLEAEIVAARVAACFAAVVKTNMDPMAMSELNSTSANDQRIENLEPGMFKYLNPGEDITQINPTRPGGNFDPFIERILRAISSGLNLPYEVVAKDFSRTNYSSARAALLEARRFFRVWQDFISRRLCQPAWEMLLEEAYLLNELPQVDFYESRLDWVRARWISPGWGWVDPTKEVEASRSSIDGNLSTLSDEAASLGRDWEEVLDQRAREKAKMEELGLENKPLVKGPDPAPAQQEQEEQPAKP